MIDMKRLLPILFIVLAFVISAAGVTPATHAQPVDFDTINDAEEGPIITASLKAAADIPKTYDAPPTTPKASLNGVMAYIVQLFAWLLGVAITTLDYAVLFTVVKMGDYVNNLSAVGITWQIMRDIGNIFIIFGFLAIGICVILDVKWYGGGFKMLPMLLVAAIFLNFSLFISQAVVDTGNLFATQFYTQINGGQPTGAKLSAGVLTGINN